MNSVDADDTSKDVELFVATLLTTEHAEGMYDLALLKCMSRPSYFELGMSVAGLASGRVCMKFREQLVRVGAFLLAMRLAKLVGQPLSREEMVALGNNHAGGLIREDVEKFIDYATASRVMFPLDIRRLKRQLGAHAF